MYVLVAMCFTPCQHHTTKMGNATSSNRGNNSSTSTAASNASDVVCYYELLGIELTATPEEIKKAYRSKALQLHPGKKRIM